ncbi:MAG TPA: hypothetical protein VMU89_14055 [Thermomicrobiaceae bacterium]|nr:hypothetical protein [Thermomicrobiaceae bacterium]
MAKLNWKEDPDDHDYPAASDYLSLTVEPEMATALVNRLRQSPIIRRKAKDLLRASLLEPLPISNVHVAKDVAKVNKGKLLSPVLLVRGRLRDSIPLTIADGCHRVCASYHIDEDADIPCRMIDLAGTTAREG